MRTLTLFRHAKAVPLTDERHDRDRALAASGPAAAVAIAERLFKFGLRPDFALISPARRTRETWEAASRVFGDVAGTTEPRIYEAMPKDLWAAIRAAPADRHSLVLVGHNPGMQSLGLALARNAGFEHQRDFDALADKMVPGAAAVFRSSDAEWNHYGLKLVFFAAPK